MRKFIVIPFEKYSRLTSKTNEQEVADKPNDAVSNIDLLTDRTEALKNTEHSESTDRKSDISQDTALQENKTNVGNSDNIDSQNKVEENQFGRGENTTKIPPPGIPNQGNKVVTVFKNNNKNRKRKLSGKSDWSILWKKY